MHVTGNTFSDRQKPLQKCPGQQCSSDRRCVPQHKVCDLQVDCLNAEDETSFCTDEFTPTLLQANPTDKEDSEGAEEVSTNSQSSPDYFSSDLSNNPFRNVYSLDKKNVTKANIWKETENSTDPVPTTSVSRDITTEFTTVEPSTTETSTVQQTTSEISTVQSTTTDSREVTTDSYSYDTTTQSHISAEDIQIIDELIHESQNSSDVFDRNQNSSVNIPPYLVDILFSTTVPPILDNVSNKINQTNHNATHLTNKNKDNETDIKFPNNQPTTKLPKKVLETPPKNYMETDPFKYYYREENRKLYEHMCKQLLEHKDSNVDNKSSDSVTGRDADQTSTPIPGIADSGKENVNTTKNNSATVLPSYLNNNLFICKR